MVQLSGARKLSDELGAAIQNGDESTNDPSFVGPSGDNNDSDSDDEDNVPEMTLGSDSSDDDNDKPQPSVL
jgi:hypothetical protein